MRIPVCVLRDHKPRHPSACYRQACANQYHASNSKYKCFGRGARTVATYATDFERPPRRTIRDRNLVTSAGTGSTYRKPLSSSTTPYRQKSPPGIYHLAGSVESQPDASSLSLVYRCATRSALWANNKSSSEPLIAKSVSIKDAGGKSGGRVSKAVELIAGDLLHVSESRLRVE